MEYLTSYDFCFFVHIEQGSVFHEICDSGGDMFDRFVCFKAYVEIRV